MESQAVFKAKLEPKIFLLNWVPEGAHAGEESDGAAHGADDVGQRDAPPPHHAHDPRLRDLHADEGLTSGMYGLIREFSRMNLMSNRMVLRQKG